MRRVVTRTALVLALALAGAACGETLDTGFPPPSPSEEDGHGGGNGHGGGGSPEPTETGGIELTGPIDVADNLFEPRDVTVKAGDEVEWSQSGTEPHTVTASDDAFDSHPDCTFGAADKCMNKGDTYDLTFDAPGEITYYCKLHGTKAGVGMAGTITVVA